MQTFGPSQLPDAFWCVVWEVGRAELPTRLVYVPEHESSELLLAADGGQVVLTQDRKWGTLAQFSDWHSHYRIQGRAAVFQCSIRIRILDFAEKAGLVWALCRPVPLALRPKERQAVTQLRRKVRQLVNYLPGAIQEQTQSLLSITDPLDMIYAVAEKHGHNANAMLAAQSVETLIRRLVRSMDARIKSERDYQVKSKPPRRKELKLRAHLLWKTSIAGVGTCCLPDSESGNNPAVGDDNIFVSTFSPGLAVALDRFTGAPVWRRQLDCLSGKSPVLNGERLYVQTSATLYCLRPLSGEDIWRFTPYGAEGEWIYTAPVLAGDRIILGDRRGFLWALDSQTGEPIWQNQLSPAQSNVNATVVTLGSKIYTASNDGEAICCELDSGRVLWRSKLEGPCSSAVQFWNGGLLYRPWSSLQLLCPETGAKLWEQELGELIRSCCVAGDYLLVVVEGQISAFLANKLVYGPIPSAPLAQLSYIAETGLVYENSLLGLSILEPSTGERIYAIEPPREIQSGAPPAYADGVLYVLSDGGKVHAITHPT